MEDRNRELARARDQLLLQMHNLRCAFYCLSPCERSRLLACLSCRLNFSCCCQTQNVQFPSFPLPPPTCSYELEQVVHIRRQLPAADERIRWAAGSALRVAAEAQGETPCFVYSCPTQAKLHSLNPRFSLTPAPSYDPRSELERQLAALRQQRADAEAALQREKALGHGRQTVGEMQQMVMAMQSELAGLKAAAEKSKGLPAALEAGT